MYKTLKQNFDLFLKIYFFASFFIIFILMTNKLNSIEKESNQLNSPIDSVEQLLEYQRQVIKSYDSQCICKSPEIKAHLESISHLRRSMRAAQEIFNYLSITFNKTDVINKKIKNRILSEISDRKNVVELELQKVSQTTGLEAFKTQRLASISKRIASRIYGLQNPPKQFCHRIRKFICKLSIDAGFASGIHEILWCLVSAFHNNQTVVLLPDWTKYFGRPSDGLERVFNSMFSSKSREEWDTVFKPLSTTCDHKSVPKNELRPQEHNNSVIARKLLNQLPKEFGSELMELVESPHSWFHSQFIGYILRPQQRVKRFIENFKNENNFRHPIVGIQVRRSDKISSKEALYYPISDYMIAVKDFYDKLDLTQVTDRRVYVASDDPTVLPELRRDYPHYIFIGSTLTAQLASSQSTRYSNSSLWGVLTDVFLLSETDYIVCTFSSAICRLSYDLMRFKQKDSSLGYRSLDVPYHYHHSLTPVRTAFYNHLAKSEDQWTFKTGDHFHERIRGRFTEWFDQAINGRGWDSYFFASNSSIQKFYKLYPNYKVYDDIDLV